MATANLVVNGSQPTLVRSGAEVIDLLAKGQGVLNILPLSGVIDELDEAIVELFPSRSAVARNGLDDVGAAAAH